MNIYLDIETIPTQRDDIKRAVSKDLTAPANYKDPEKIKAYIEAETDNAVRKTALEGWAGEVWCIGFAVGFECVNILPRKGDGEVEHSEAGILDEFCRQVPKTTTWIGHNVSWDLRFLWQRCKVLGVDTRGIDFCLAAKPWDNNPIDTMTLWAGTRDRISLKKLALAFGLDAKDGMDGSKVWDAVKEGRWREVADYCKADVELTRTIYQRLK